MRDWARRVLRLPVALRFWFFWAWWHPGRKFFKNLGGWNSRQLHRPIELQLEPKFNWFAGLPTLHPMFRSHLSVNLTPRPTQINSCSLNASLNCVTAPT